MQEELVYIYAITLTSDILRKLYYTMNEREHKNKFRVGDVVHITLIDDSINLVFSIKIIKFLFIGGITALFLFLVLYTLHGIFKIWYVVASAIAYILTTLLGFGLQKFWTFRNKSIEKIKLQIIAYSLLAVVNFFANILLMYTFIEILHIHYLLAQFLTLSIIALWDFLLYSFFIFKR